MTTLNIPGMNTDRSKARSDYDPAERVVAVGGTLADVKAIPNNDMSRARLAFVINPVTHIKRANDRETDPASMKDGFTVSYDFGKWDDKAKEPVGPNRDDIWFEAHLEGLALGGFDTSSGDKLLAEFGARIGNDINFVERTIERKNRKGETYEVAKRDPETRDLLPPVNHEDDDVTYDETANRWSDNAVFEKETATYQQLYPAAEGESLEVQSESGETVDGDPVVRAAELFAEHDGDYAAFKKAAIADAVIKQDPALRNTIITGDYEG